MPRKKRRRRIEPADNHTPDLTRPCCEAEGCTFFPFYGVDVPSMPRKVWLCYTHWRYAILDEMRAKTRVWQRQQLDLWQVRFQTWFERCPLLVQMEVKAAEEGWAATEWIKAIVVKIGEVSTLIHLRRYEGSRPLLWGANLRLGDVAL